MIISVKHMSMYKALQGCLMFPFEMKVIKRQRMYTKQANGVPKIYFVFLFKRLVYTLTAYCYGSKSVMQPNASSKRYLWDKISCQTYRTQNYSDRYQFQNIAKKRSKIEIKIVIPLNLSSYTAIIYAIQKAVIGSLH